MDTPFKIIDLVLWMSPPTVKISLVLNPALISNIFWMVYSSLDSSAHCPHWPIILQIKHQTCSDWLRLSHTLCSVLRNIFLVPGKRESWCVLWNDLFDSQLRHWPWPTRLWHPGLWLCRGRPTALPPLCTPHLGSPTAPLQTAAGYLKCQCWGQEQTDTAYKQ